jgi:hypothetical protein
MPLDPGTTALLELMGPFSPAATAALDDTVARIRILLHR